MMQTRQQQQPGLLRTSAIGDIIDASIILVTQARSALLADTLSSAVSQKDVDFEIVLAGELPHDRSPVLTDLLLDDRVRVEPSHGASGPAAAANLAVRSAHGPWIAFLAECDLWAPWHLATLVGACEDQGADFGYSASWVVDEDRCIRGFRTVPPPQVLAGALLAEDAIGTMSCVVARRELFGRAGGFDEWLTVLASWDLWLRWSRAGRACMVSEATVATTLIAPTAAHRRELRELRRRYRGDARQLRVRFGHAVRGTSMSEPLAGVRPPWLEDQLGAPRKST